MGTNLISDVLRAAIRERGISLHELGRQADVERASLSRFMRQERCLRSDAIDRIALFLSLELKPVARRRKA